MFKDSEEIINNLLGTDNDDKKNDFLRRENSNFIYSLSLLRHQIDNFEEEKYLMKNVLPQSLVETAKTGEIYIHDKKLQPYCVSVSCRDIAMKGIPALAKNMVESTSAKNLFILTRHFSNIVTFFSQQVSGAVMLSQMTTVAASYLYLEETMRNRIYSPWLLKNVFQSLIWELNEPLRSGSQTPFSNITMEFGKSSAEIEDDYIIFEGETQTMKYKDIPSEYFDRINDVIIDIMAKGGTNTIFTFPLITIPYTDNFDKTNPIYLKLLSRMEEWGGCYFENFRSKAFNEKNKYTELNPLLKKRDPSVTRSLCCRLNIDLEKLSKIGGGVFGSSSGGTGAVQVLNLNINRVFIQYYDKGIDAVLDRINYLLEIMQEGHQAKRKFVEDNKNLFPNFFAFNKDLKNYFNVFALTGMHEALINVGFKDGIKNEDGKALTHMILQKIHEKLDFFIDRDNVACGLEYAPAENAAIKMARNDLKWAKANGKDIFLQGMDEENPYLTSGAMTPFSEDDFSEQIENASEFQGYATSGSILHHFIEDKINAGIVADYIENLFDTKPLIYLTMSNTLSTCNSCGHKIKGRDVENIEKCPVCSGNDITVYGRVIGYVKPIARKNLKIKKGYTVGDYNFWSKARRADWTVRRKITMDDIKKETDKFQKR